MPEPITLTASEIQKSLFERLVLEPAFDFFRKLSPRTQGILLLLVSLILVISALWAMVALGSYTKFMGATLQQPLETNDQPYKGLEAYLLSGVNHLAKGRWGDSSTRKEFIVLQDRLDGATMDSLTAPASVDKFLVTVPASTSTIRDQYITTVNREAFLFQPAMFLQGAAASLIVDSTEIRTVLRSNPQLLMELNAALLSVPALQSLDHASIDGLPIVQSYFLTDLGTLMIRRNAIGGMDSSFVRSFPPRRFFPERPYFWRALDGLHRKGQFDYVSAPYVDYGGLGVVRTYVVRFRLPGQRRPAIIGIDCGIPHGEELIVSRFATLLPPMERFRRRQPLIVAAIHENQGITLFAPHGEAVPEWLKQLAVRFKTAGSDVRGQISSDHDVGVEGHRFEYAIPVGLTEINGRAATRMVVAPVDLDAVLNLWLPGIICIVMSLIFGGIIRFFYHVHVIQRREQESVLRGVGDIMAYASTPFAWLDEHNQFVRANDSFIRVLEYESLEDLQGTPSGRRRTFREMLVLRDQAAYDALLRRSANLVSTDPYWCTIHTKSGALLSVHVHGERMPFGGIWRNEGPQRFGVFLSWKRLEQGEDQEAGREHQLPPVFAGVLSGFGLAILALLTPDFLRSLRNITSQLGRRTRQALGKY